MDSSVYVHCKALNFANKKSVMEFTFGVMLANAIAVVNIEKETVTNWFCLFFAFIYAFQNTLYPLYASYKSNLLVTS